MRQTTKNFPDGVTLLKEIKLPGTPLRLRWAPSEDLLACPTDTGNLFLLGPEQELFKLGGHKGRIYEANFSHNSNYLASCSLDRTVGLWDLRTRERLALMSQDSPVRAVAWSRSSGDLYYGTESGHVFVYNPKTSTTIVHSTHRRAVNCLAFSQSGERFAAACDDGNVMVYKLKGNQFLGEYPNAGNIPYDLEWARSRQILIALASAHPVVSIITGNNLRFLEGHTAKLLGVSFSHDGKILASKSADHTIRLWRTDTWDFVGSIRDPSQAMGGIAFHPTKPILASACVTDQEQSIRYWQLDISLLLEAEPSEYLEYSNAKVVLIGDSGVGKSGLGLVLGKKAFTATESTHGRRIWSLETKRFSLENNREATREVILWDLAGQPGYRLIHQLSLNEIAVALVVFDSKSETDPFGGVRYWVRALRQAQTAYRENVTLRKILVAARTDRGGINASMERIRLVIKEMGFDEYFATSAKAGTQVKELRQAILDGIDWNALPRVNSSKLFQKIKAFLLQEKTRGRVLSVLGDLFHAFVASNPDDSDDLEPQFSTCVRLMESRGLIRRLSFGNLVLLQPELLDAYASSIVDAAKTEPEGLGSVAEEEIKHARFTMSDDDRVSDREQERLLLLATIEDLLKYEIALREGLHLVFPSQITRENPDLPDPEGKTLIFIFEGAVLNVYATLVVRLSHSAVFTKSGMWKNAATLVTKVGGTCGIFLREIDEGRAELTLFFSADASEETRYQFEQFVEHHLQKRAAPASIARRRIYTCGNCSTPLSDLQVKRRKERGHHDMGCPVCEARVSLLDREDRLRRPPTSRLAEMDRAADEVRRRETAITVTAAKVAVKEFDVFLAHNTQDKPTIQIIAEQLKRKGINPWIDSDQVPPGRWFQEVIQDAIPNVKSAAIFLGPKGLGRWQALEVRSFIAQCVERGLPVIPVLLPGVVQIPSELPFLKELNYVQFKESAEEPEALDRLQWGITQSKPHHD